MIKTVSSLLNLLCQLKELPVCDWHALDVNCIETNGTELDQNELNRVITEEGVILEQIKLKFYLHCLEDFGIPYLSMSHW